MTQRRLILTVLDGFGLSPATKGNAIATARTPVFEALVSHYPTVTLTAHGTEVGLGWGEMGNSEVGHLNLGAGRIVVQDVTRIAQSIADRSILSNKALLAACETVKASGGTLHILGLASTGGVHGHVDTLPALLELAHTHQLAQVALHIIADGRDAEPKSLGQYLERVERARTKFGGEYATLMGRYWAMDRDRHWDRTERAYRALVEGKGTAASLITDAITQSYAADKTDEFIEPVIFDPDRPELRIRPGDVVIFTNHRSDRARQLARALAAPDFDEFTRATPVSNLVTFTGYGVELANTEVAFATDSVSHSLADVLDHAGLRQFHVAETEKYAHVTYFFNGYLEEPLGGEARQLIQSPKVDTYDQAPAMAAAKVVDAVLDGYQAHTFDVAIVNLANADMVGHTGNLEATVSAIETIDAELKRLAEAVLAGGDVLMITADHGNAEQLIHPETGDIDKEHTTNPVPLILVDNQRRRATPLTQAKQTVLGMAPIGLLADVAPTILELLGQLKPDDMTGESLLPELK